MKFLGQAVHAILILIKLIKLFSKKNESIYSPPKSITSPSDLIERENKAKGMLQCSKTSMPLKNKSDAEANMSLFLLLT